MSDLRETGGGESEWAWVRNAYLATPPADERAVDAVIARVTADSGAVPSSPVSLPSNRKTWKSRRTHIAVGVAAAIVAAVLLTTDRDDSRVVLKPGPPASVAVALGGAADSQAVPAISDSFGRPGTAVTGASRPATIARVDSPATPVVSRDARVVEAAPRVLAQSQPAAVDTAAILSADAGSFATLRMRLDSSSLRQLVRIASSARERGLPVVPITERAIQGVRRNVADSVVIATARGVAARLTVASEALGPQSSSDELTAGADALLAGATPSMLRSLRASRSSGMAVVPLVVLTDLMTNGVPADAAAGAVRSMITSRPPSAAAEVDAGMLAMRTEVAADVARGATPTAAVTARVRARTETSPPGVRSGTTIPPTPSPGVPTPKPPENF